MSGDVQSTDFVCACEPEKNGGCEARRGSAPELCSAVEAAVPPRHFFEPDFRSDRCVACGHGLGETSHVDSWTSETRNPPAAHTPGWPCGGQIKCPRCCEAEAVPDPWCTGCNPSGGSVYPPCEAHAGPRKPPASPATEGEASA